MIFMVHAEPGRRFALSEQLAAHSSVNRVWLTNGAAELIVTASFKDDDAALRFLVDVVEGSPDVRDSAAATVISEVGASSNAAEDARVPTLDRAALLDAVIRPPKLQDVSEFLAWMSGAARRAFTADHALCIVFEVPKPGEVVEEHVYPPIVASATSGLPDGYLARMRALLEGAGHAGVIRHAFLSRQHVFVDDARTSPLMRGTEAVVEEIGYRSMLAMPMLFGAEPFGICTLYFDRIIRLDTEYVSAVQNWVDQCSVTISRLDPTVLRPAPDESVPRR